MKRYYVHTNFMIFTFKHLTLNNLINCYHNSATCLLNEHNCMNHILIIILPSLTSRPETAMRTILLIGGFTPNRLFKSLA